MLKRTLLLPFLGNLKKHFNAILHVSAPDKFFWIQKGLCITTEVRWLQIKESFGHSLELASKGELDHWKSTPRGRVALVILLDQFSRNIYRDTPRSFAQDEVALDISLDTINKVSELPTQLRKFQSDRLAIEWKQKLLSLGVNFSSILSMIYLGTCISGISQDLQKFAWLSMVSWRVLYAIYELLMNMLSPLISGIG